MRRMWNGQRRRGLCRILPSRALVVQAETPIYRRESQGRGKSLLQNTRYPTSTVWFTPSALLGISSLKGEIGWSNRRHFFVSGIICGRKRDLMADEGLASLISLLEGEMSGRTKG